MLVDNSMVLGLFLGSIVINMRKSHDNSVAKSCGCVL